MNEMQDKNKDIYVVPLAINYERIFEMNNLASEMVSGHPPTVSAVKLFNMIKGVSNEQLGKAFVFFAQPFNMKSYLQGTILNGSNIDEIGLQLTEKLLKDQQSHTPVNLNMIVCTLLL